MSAFTEFDQFEPVPGASKKYRLTADLVWEIGSKGSGWFLTVASGTVFDISVPRWLEWVQSPHDTRVLLGAAIHDELGKLGHDVAFGSAEFRRACTAGGVGPVRAWALFYVTLVHTALWRLKNWGSLEMPPDLRSK